MHLNDLEEEDEKLTHCTHTLLPSDYFEERRPPPCKMKKDPYRKMRAFFFILFGSGKPFSILLLARFLQRQPAWLWVVLVQLLLCVPLSSLLRVVHTCLAILRKYFVLPLQQSRFVEYISLSLQHTGLVLDK